MRHDLTFVMDTTPHIQQNTAQQYNFMKFLENPATFRQTRPYHITYLYKIRQPQGGALDLLSGIVDIRIIACQCLLGYLWLFRCGVQFQVDNAALHIFLWLHVPKLQEWTILLNIERTPMT